MMLFYHTRNLTINYIHTNSELTFSDEVYDHPLRTVPTDDTRVEKKRAA